MRSCLLNMSLANKIISDVILFLEIISFARTLYNFAATQ